MNLDSKLLEAFKNFTFDDSEPDDKYFKDKLKKLKFDDYNDLMRKYIIEAVSFGSVDMNEFDRDIDELLRRETPLGNKKNNNMIEIPILRNVYKKSVTTNVFIKVGAVTRFGLMDFDTPSDKFVTNPDYYYPEFYTDVEITKIVKAEFPRFNDKGEKCGTYMKDVSSYVSSIDKEVFTPRNLPQQTISLVDSLFLKPEEYYVTGYVTREGRVYYYDQYL